MRLEAKPISDHNDLVSVEVHPRPPSTRPPSSQQQQNILTLQLNKAASSVASRPNSRLDALQAHQKTTSSLQQLQALDLFQSQHTDEDEDSNDEEEDNIGFRLETDHYVRQIKQRRGLLFAQIDSTPAERLRRKVGYEIERR